MGVAVAAATPVQVVSLIGAVLGTVVIVPAFLVGLCARTPTLTDQPSLEFMYSAGAGTADVIMLVGMYLFEMDGSDEGGWIKIVNLLATIIDLVLKVLQAAWAIPGTAADAGREQLCLE